MASLAKWWAGGSNFGNATDDRGAAASHREPTPGTWPGAPLGSRITIRLGRIHKSPREQPRDSEHEPSSKSVRQRELRKFHEDTEAGRNLHQQLQRPGTFASKYRRVHRAVLQSAALALGAGLSTSRRVRATDRGVRSGRLAKRDDGVF